MISQLASNFRAHATVWRSGMSALPSRVPKQGRRGVALFPPRRLNEIRVRREVKGEFDLHDLAKEGDVVRANRVSVEHLRVVLYRDIKLKAKCGEIEGLEFVDVDDLL